MNTINDVKEMLSKQLKIDINKIGDDSNIVEDLGADSIDLVEMLMIIEEKLSITISDEDALKLKTVRDVAEYINSRKK